MRRLSHLKVEPINPAHNRVVTFVRKHFMDLIQVAEGFIDVPYELGMPAFAKLVNGLWGLGLKYQSVILPHVDEPPVE